ncbi:MAG: hypothetical protein AAGK78_02435 [Planctomycetota bacterium]
MAQSTHNLLSLARPGIEGVKRNWPAMLLLQFVALLLVLGYYFVPAMTRGFDRLAIWKQSTGLLGVAALTVLAGVAFPKIARLAVGKPATDSRFGLTHELVFLTVLFAINGVMVEFFYRGLGLLYGTENTWSVIVPKVLTDMFFFTPMIALPYIALCFTVRDHGYRLGPSLREVGPAWYMRRVMTLQIPGWCYWAPIVTLVYSLPSSLQFMLFAFAMAAWSLVMVFIGDSVQDKSPAAQVVR